METRLAPIEKPKGLYLKIVYWFTRRMFGKVLLPLKVTGARMPASLKLSMPLVRIENGLSLPPELVALLKVHIATQNECHFCTDIGLAMAIKKRIGTERFTHLAHYRTSTVFTDAERAALRFVEEVNTDCDATDETFNALRPHYTERQIVELAWICAVENYYNRLARPFGLHNDGLVALAQQHGRKA